MLMKLTIAAENFFKTPWRIITNMVSDIAISVKNISKKYRLFATAHDRLKEALHPFRRQFHEEFWALRDVNFEVIRGETLGVIGRNGSGKSTLLQIIANILKPTIGQVFAAGRIAALLELGTGFNPEFTGRENAILNGAIMGFTHREILARMPDIENFADIGVFFDQPMKIYSSGMFVRVAFAAAISVDPEILIIDEALSVGDAKFQHKCFEKINTFQESGKTVILVTHDMEAVAKHCRRALLLEKGELIADGNPAKIIPIYIDIMEDRLDHNQPQNGDHLKTAHVLNVDSRDDEKGIINTFLDTHCPKDVCQLRKSYNPKEQHQQSNYALISDYLILCNGIIDPTIITSGETIDVFLKVVFNIDVEWPCFGVSIKTKDAVTIYALNSRWTEMIPEAVKKGEQRVVKFRIPMKLNSGDIFIDFGIDEGRESSQEFKNISRRVGIVHLLVRSTRLFDGVADLGADFFRAFHE